MLEQPDHCVFPSYRDAPLGAATCKSDFIWAAVELKVSLRKSPGYEDLAAHLLANETVRDFCLKAILRAVAQRKVALADDGSHNPGSAE